MTRFYTCIALLAAGAFGVVASQACGEDFRVDNAVYVEGQKEPSSESTTIFYDGVVYDCLKSPAETVVFDPKTGRFVLLNLTRRKRAELTTAKITMLINGLRLKTADSKDPLMKFLAEPKFQEHFDEATHELTLSSPWISYRLVLAPESSPSVVEQYREFCDWYARLNTLLVPGSLPPFGRLVVNAAMAKHQATASQSWLTVVEGNETKQQRTTIRSEYRVVRPLESADLDRVAQARESMSSFKLVDFMKQYRKIESR